MDDIKMIVYQDDDDDDQEEVVVEATTSTNALKPTPSSSRIIKKKKGVFRKDWLFNGEYSSWLQEVTHDSTKARCKACLKTFSVYADGKTALEKHRNSNAHKKSMISFQNNGALAQFITPENELDKISATECVLVFHGVKHGHSYRSQACNTDLLRTLFQSSTIAKAISCGKTKARAIACNVLGPYFTNKIVDDVLKSRFYSLSVDASNRSYFKMFPFAVQYFSDTGVSRGNSFLIRKFFPCIERIFRFI